MSPRSMAPPMAANNLPGKLTTRHPPLGCDSPLNRPQKFDHPLFYRRSFMATSTRNATSGSSPALAENLERERTFDLFRQWGYLEADLDPLGLITPQTLPDLQIDNEWAQEARRVYCGSVGAEFMH